MQLYIKRPTHSQIRRPGTMLEIRRKTIFKVTNKSIIYKRREDFTNSRQKTYRGQFILKYKDNS